MVSYDLTFESTVDCHTPDVRLSLFSLKAATHHYCPVEGERLSRPSHRSTGVQPMPKAVYRSGFVKTQTVCSAGLA